MGRGWLVIALLELSEADVVDDEESGASPRSQALGIRTIGEARMQIVEQIDTARVAHRDTSLAGLEGNCLEEVALSRACLSRDDDVFSAVDEVEMAELDDKVFVERGLKIPIEGFERFALL